MCERKYSKCYHNIMSYYRILLRYIRNTDRVLPACNIIIVTNYFFQRSKQSFWTGEMAFFVADRKRNCVRYNVDKFYYEWWRPWTWSEYFFSFISRACFITYSTESLCLIKFFSHYLAFSVFRLFALFGHFFLFYWNLIFFFYKNY